MENRNIITLRYRPHWHHVDLTDSFYAKQFCDGETAADYVVVDTTSENQKSKRDLSPFCLGPCIASDGLKANCVENLWQYSKVYAGTVVYHNNIGRSKTAPREIEVVCADAAGNPTEEWFAMRRYGYSLSRANRKPVDKRIQPLYFYYVENGNVQRLNYIEARKKIYIPAYARLVVCTDAFKQLKKIVNSGQKLALVDFDGNNYYNSRWMEERFYADLKCAEKNLSASLSPWKIIWGSTPSKTLSTIRIFHWDTLLLSRPCFKTTSRSTRTARSRTMLAC